MAIYLYDYDARHTDACTFQIVCANGNFGLIINRNPEINLKQKNDHNEDKQAWNLTILTP